MDTQDFFLMVLGMIFAVIALTGLITFVHFRADVAKTKREADRAIPLTPPIIYRIRARRHDF